MGELSDGQDLSAAESPAQAKVMHYLQFIAGVLGQVCESRQRRVLCGLGDASLTLLCRRQGLCCPTPRHGSFWMPSASLERSSTASRQHSAPPSPYRVPPSPPRLRGSTQRRSRWHALVKHGHLRSGLAPRELRCSSPMAALRCRLLGCGRRQLERQPG